VPTRPPAAAGPDLPPRATRAADAARGRARAAVRSGRAAARALTGRAGALPGFVVVGAQRCGTTSLFDDLCRHPQVRRPTGKELQYFTLHHRRPLAWYRGHFPVTGPDEQTFEASPYYLFHPHAAERFAAALPTTRAVVLLRDPVERAVSHHLHSVRSGLERLPLGAALAAEPARMARAERLGVDSRAGHRLLRAGSYAARGRYGEQLARWVGALGRERVHVVRSEDLHADPAHHLAALQAFLGLDPVPLDHARRTRRRDDGRPDPLPAARRLLEGVFDADDAVLRRVTGWTSTW